MKPGLVSVSLFLALFPLLSQAKFRPVVSMSAGADVIHIHMNQNISLISPFQNSYVSNNRVVDAVSGLFLGIETSLFNGVLNQLGISYYQNQSYQAQGLVYQFADPSMGNLYYQYNIQSQRVLLESKILTTFHERYHPFLNIGIGETINTASQYTETGVTSADVPTANGFGDKTIHSFAYLAGAGIEMDVMAHIRLGAMYRYVNLGRAQLSTTSNQQSQTTLKNNPLYVNEFLLQISYLG